MSANVQYSLPDGDMSLHISDALMANSASTDLATHIKDDPAIKLGRSSDYHLKTRSKTSVFNCDVCERTFESAEYLSSHVLSHSLDIGAYSCEICHKVFNEKHDLAQHKCLQSTDMHSQNLIHNPNTFHPQADVPRSNMNGPYVCMTGIGNSGDGDNPMDPDYNLGLKGMQLFNCEYCEKKFKTNSALLIHRRSHTGETPYPCEFCGKSFRQSAHLDVHMRIHTGEMPYKCAYCDKSFTQKNNRNRHQMLHLNPNGQEPGPDMLPSKPLNENCLNNTPTAPTIDMSSEAPRHLMNSYDNPSITQQPPPLPPPPPPPPSVGTNYPQPNPSAGSMQFTYTCSICQKVYSNNSALSQHMQTHNKETSFDCYVCNHKFKQRAHLETHLRVHTHEMPYKCQYCDKCFSQKGNKNRHERLHLINDNADMSGTLPPPPPPPSSSSTSLSSSVPMETTINSAKNCIQQPNIYIDSEFASCDICHKQFFSKDDLHTHRNTHHSLSGDPSMNNTINMNSSQPQMNTSPYGPPYANISPDKNYHVKEAPQVHYTPNKPMIVDPSSTSPASNMANKTYYDGGNVRMQESLIRQGDSDCCNVNPSHPSPCEVCGQEISCQQDMLQHTQCHKGVFTCEYCPKEFRSNSALLVHRRVHTGETPYKCDFCDKGFKQAPHLDVHLRTHTGEMPFQCLYCDKKFSQNSNKNRHQRSHFMGETSSGFNSPAPMNPSSVNPENDQENSYNLKCELCGCTFSDRNSFVNHMLSHQSLSENTGVMPADNQKTPTHGLTHLYQCMICNASFSCQPSLDNHIAVAHNNKSGPTSCNSDNMQFGPQQTHDDFNNMRSNQRRTTDYVNMPPLGTSSEISNSGHTGDGNNYMPPQNTNNYYDMRNSNIENSSSTNVSGENEGLLNCQEQYGGYGLNREPVVNMNCEFCQKNFKSVSSLMIHRRVHTGETPFECSFCHRGFKQNAHLEVHMRTHTGETPYKCEFCDKRFSQKSNRDRHQRTHLIDAVSLQNSNMDFPMENVEGKDDTSVDQSSEPYKCDICSSVFSNHDDFTDHRSCHDIPCFSDDSNFHRQQNRRKYDNMDNNPHPSRSQDGGESGVYKCDLCGCYYSNISDLRHHQSSQHSQSSYHQGDTPRNGPEGSSSQYPVDVDSYNYQPEAKRYRSERNYSHQSSGYQDNEGSRMAGSVSRPNTSFHGRSETNYMRPDDNSYCEMGNNYCSTSKKHGHHQTLPHHGDLGSTSSKGGDEMSSSGPHACNFCQRSFRSMSALMVHRKVHTEEDPYQCDYCNKCFKQDAHHDVHMHSHAGETSFECDLCDKQFMQNNHHNHHQQKHLDNTVGMPGQVDMHNREASYRCDVCPSEFRNQEQFMDHRSCHDIPQKYEDSVNQNVATPRRGRRRTSVKNYVEIDDDDDFNHDDDRPVNDVSYGCNQCDENCMGLNERQRHNAKKNESHRLAPPLSTSYRDTKKYSSYRGDSYQCEICFQKFYKEEELCQHRLVHMTNPHVGDKNKAYSPHHNAAVTGKYPDPCTVGIDKEDGSYGNMNHKMTGNPCELCCKIFSSTSALTTHMRVHTGEAPFKCDFCHRAFKQTAHLEVHMRVHTGEMPFKCHYCEKRFTQKNNMLRHEKIHHGDASGHRNSMAMDVESLDSHCQTCEAQCQEQTHIPDPHQPKCPGTPDSVSNCDICCKDSSVKPDLCQYSERRHHNSHHQKRSSYDNGQKIGRGNYVEKSTLDSKDQIQTYDCCQDSCLESFHDNPELENKASDYSIQSDMAPVESLALQLPYACRHCKIEFLNQEDLCDHEPQCEAANIVSPGASSKFPLLNNTENEAVYLDENHGLSNVHQCEFCQKVFKSFSSLSVHRRVHTGEAPFQCHFCQRRFKQNSHLEVHLRTHTDEAPYKCEFCDKCFTQAGNRNRHQRTHFMDAVSLAAADFEMLEQEDPNIQGQSSERFVEGQDYELESEIPNPTDNDDDYDDQGDNDLGQIDQSIEGNDKSGTTSGEAEMMTEQKTKRKRGRPKGSRSYFKIERNPSPETVKIEIDDDITLDEKSNPSSRPRTRSLSHRLRNSCSKKPSPQTETPEASFNCSVCSLVFSSVEELSRHQDSANHVNDPGQSTENVTFTCEYCDKTFTNGSALAVHRRVHTGESPFQCQYCQKSFKQNAHLDVHMRIHTGEMPFQCAFCDKRFTQNCNRLRHQKTHFTNVTSGENGVAALSSDAIETCDFKCELCNQEFDTKHMFDNHVCVDNSYNDDLQPLLPLQDNGRQSSENKISVPDKESLESSESLEREEFEKISNDSSKGATSEYLKTKKWIKEEKNLQKDFGHFQQTGTTEEQGESSCDENHLDDMDEASSEKRDGSELKYGNFSCDFCSRTFRSQSALLNHRRIHTGETPYQCKYCSKSFKQVAHLDTHLRVHTGEKPYECKYCQKSFTQKSNRNRHEQLHEMSGKDLSTTGSVPEYRCELCDGYFANAADLDMHHCTMTAADEWSSHAEDTDISADSQNLPYTCNICGKEYSSRIRYEKHRQTHEQGWKEENMSPLMERNGQSTALAGNDQGIFNCEVCRQKFTDKTEYTDHIFMHISENPYQQNKGSKKSSKIVPVDQIREVCYLCEICQNEFYSTTEFTNHVCSKNMANVKEPMNRYASQNSENLESAEYNNDDVGSSDLGQSVDYPEDYPADVSFYNCDYCEKSFKNHSTMLIHRRVHTGEMPFKCKFCERCFKQNAHLEVHLRTHTGETPFHCRFCEKSFTQKSNRNRHERTHLMNAEGEGQPGDIASFEDNLHCHTCSIDFPTEEDLKEHLMTHPDNVGEGPGFQPIGSYLTTLKEEQEMYERATASTNHYTSGFSDTYSESTSMANLNDMEAGSNAEDPHVMTSNKLDSSGQFYECEFCLKQLKSLSSLIVHRRVHTGEVLFRCM